MFYAKVARSHLDKRVVIVWAFIMVLDGNIIYIFITLSFWYVAGILIDVKAALIGQGNCLVWNRLWAIHDDVIKWKHFPRYWPFVRGIHRSPVNSPHKGQWRGALMFTLICARINVWVNNHEAGDLRRNRVHYDVIVMIARASKAQDQ